jgi:hypothetical protein
VAPPLPFPHLTSGPFLTSLFRSMKAQLALSPLQAPAFAVSSSLLPLS